MDLNDTPEQAEYRAKVRGWLEAHASDAPVLSGPNALRDEDEIVAARRAWQGRLAEGGLAGGTWPREYGGQGRGPVEGGSGKQGVSPARGPGIPAGIGA